jgi:hypothetical protein
VKFDQFESPFGSISGLSLKTMASSHFLQIKYNSQSINFEYVYLIFSIRSFIIIIIIIIINNIIIINVQSSPSKFLAQQYPLLLLLFPLGEDGFHCNIALAEQTLRA